MAQYRNAPSGKAFENHFKAGWEECFPDGALIRLYDITMGYKNINNICDFIGYVYPNMFMLECKAHAGASIPFGKISQYDKLVRFSGIKGIRSGVVLYLYDKQKVFYIPASTMKKMKEDGKKSVGLKAVEEGYRIIEIPSESMRVFMKSDYTVLKNLEEGD